MTTAPTANRILTQIQPLPFVRRDMLPEHGHYPDTGCHLHPSCLRCPRAVCIEDERDEEVLDMRTRNQEIVGRREAGEPPVHIVARMGFALRTVYRVLHREARSRPLAMRGWGD